MTVPHPRPHREENPLENFSEPSGHLDDLKDLQRVDDDLERANDLHRVIDRRYCAGRSRTAEYFLQDQLRHSQALQDARAVQACMRGVFKRLSALSEPVCIQAFGLDKPVAAAFQFVRIQP